MRLRQSSWTRPRMRAVMTLLRQVAVDANGRADIESFSTMRSSCGT